MSETLLGPGEIIYNQNDMDDKLYFVIKGEVETFIDKKSLDSISVNKFHKG